MYMYTGTCTQVTDSKVNSAHTMRRVKAALHNLESASYATNDASKLETLLQKLEELNQSLPSEQGLCLCPRVLVSRAKKIKQRALKRLQRAANLSSTCEC